MAITYHNLFPGLIMGSSQCQPRQTLLYSKSYLFCFYQGVPTQIWGLNFKYECVLKFLLYISASSPFLGTLHQGQSLKDGSTSHLSYSYSAQAEFGDSR